ncbi:tail fiber assembly protein [Yersinia canariae]|uniref:tail fiber assembly protein n=1 Tax=Yersinia canariae TaxID=2607663 RepID=UPI00119D0428|nr:tail fiber assembly protein [Yersinia canariae]
MIVYLYDNKTFEFTGLWDAQESPLEPGAFLTPSASTEIAPIAKSGYASIWNGNKWGYIEDHRGELRYSSITGHPIEVTNLGEYPATTTDIAPGDLEKWDREKWVTDTDAVKREAAEKKVELKAIADSEIDWRQDAVDGDYAEPKKVVELAAWKKYRVLLMRIDASKAPDIEWPVEPVSQALNISTRSGLDFLFKYSA